MTLPHDVNELQLKMRDAVRAHWKAFLFEGILLSILGLAAMIVPPLAGLAVTIFLGWMFLISGIAGLVVSYWAREMPGFWWSLISAALRARTPPRIVRALVVDANRRSDGYHHRRPDRRRSAGIGGMGDRTIGRNQPVVRRRHADRCCARVTKRQNLNRPGAAVSDYGMTRPCSFAIEPSHDHRRHQLFLVF